MTTQKFLKKFLSGIQMVVHFKLYQNTYKNEGTNSKILELNFTEKFTNLLIFFLNK